MKALILAAGLGTRLKPLTDHIPKALVEVNGRPLLDHAIERVKSCSIHEIIINTHHFSEQMMARIKNYNDPEVELVISDESDMLLDTGGAIKKAEWFLKKNNSFLVYNVDILSRFDLNDLLSFHKTNKGIASLAVSERESSRYLLFDESNNLCSWQNVKTGEKKISRDADQTKQYAFSGIHVLDSEIFEYMPKERKFSIIDVFLTAGGTRDIKAFVHKPDEILDAGKPESLDKAENFLQKHGDSYVKRNC